MSDATNNRFYREPEAKLSGSLKPCPFCGEDQAFSLHSCGRHAITCNICFTEGPSADSPDAAIEGWQTRTAHAGDSLRDELAKHALTCIPHIGCGADLDIADIAGAAYQLADAMLGARRQPGSAA